MEFFLLFIVYSFFGCVAENIYYFILHGKYTSKQMLLNLPLCPVYGIACLLLDAVSNKNDGLILLFCSGFLTVSATELAFYLISERIYGIKWWDYSKMKIHLMGGVSLFYSVMWGFCNIVFSKFINPYFSTWIYSLPHTVKLFAGLFLAVYFFADLKETHIELKKCQRGEKSLIPEKFKYITLNN